MKPRRRTILKVIALLAAGAAVNVAVAWGIPLIPQRIRDDSYLGPNRSGQEAMGFYWKAIGFERVAPPRSPFAAGSRERTFINAGVPNNDWSRIRQGKAPGRNLEEARGWPMKSLFCYFEMDTCILREGIGLGQAKSSLVAYRGESAVKTIDFPFVPSYLLPLMPLWPGFAINTVCYAGVLWVLWSTLFALRRLIRRRSGQCAHCAYPIGQNERCTECGAAVMSKALQA